MNVVLFGATGMVGAGALAECLADQRVRSVVALTRSPIGPRLRSGQGPRLRSGQGRMHSKLREVRRDDFFHYNGTDSSERGRTIWARVKGKTENALLALPFKAAFMFRPGYIQPVGAVRSRTGWVQASYTVIAPFYPILRRLLANATTTTANLGRALIEVAAAGYPKPVLYSQDMNCLAVGRPSQGRR